MRFLPLFLLSAQPTLSRCKRRRMLFTILALYCMPLRSVAPLQLCLWLYIRFQMKKHETTNQCEISVTLFSLGSELGLFVVSNVNVEEGLTLVWN